LKRRERDMEDAMPIFMKMDGIDGKVESSSPPVSEIVVTKSMDATSPLLFDAAEFFIPDGTSNITDGTSNTADAHSGGVNLALCDGSVRLTDTSLGTVFSGFDLV